MRPTQDSIITIKYRLAGDITTWEYNSDKFSGAKGAAFRNISILWRSIVLQSSSNLLLPSYKITWRHLSSEMGGGRAEIFDYTTKQEITENIHSRLPSPLSTFEQYLRRSIVQARCSKGST